MPKADDKKPLGAWPDDLKHQETDPGQNDENSLEGIEDTARDQDQADTLDNAHSMDLYKNSDEEHPAELNIADEIQKAENEQK